MLVDKLSARQKLMRTLINAAPQTKLVKVRKLTQIEVLEHLGV